MSTPARRTLTSRSSPSAVSTGMCRALELARRFAPSTLPILLVGPTGTGKEVLAQAIHRWSGRRRPLVGLDCGTVPPALVSGVLFGHRKGAFTTALEAATGLIQEADHGTLFLDELLSLPLDGQAALLRVLETGEARRVGDPVVQQVSLRVIASLQEDGAGQVRSGRLRHDLYHRLAGGVIRLLALEDRPEDLWPLAVSFAQVLGRHIAPAGRMVLERHAWPGNVRELKFVIQRATCLETTPGLSARALAEAIDLGCPEIGVDGRELVNGSERRTAADDPLVHRRAELVRACREARGDREQAARILNVSVATLYRRLRAAGVTLGRLSRDQRAQGGLESPYSHRIVGSRSVHPGNPDSQNYLPSGIVAS